MPAPATAASVVKQLAGTSGAKATARAVDSNPAMELTLRSSLERRALTFRHVVVDRPGGVLVFTGSALTTAIAELNGAWSTWVNSARLTGRRPLPTQGVPFADPDGLFSVRLPVGTTAQQSEPGRWTLRGPVVDGAFVAGQIQLGVWRPRTPVATDQPPAVADLNHLRDTWVAQVKRTSAASPEAQLVTRAGAAVGVSLVTVHKDGSVEWAAQVPGPLTLVRLSLRCPGAARSLVEGAFRACIGSLEARNPSRKGHE
jgi:hypothetical protein